jgi:serine/threonine-protein kinase
MYELLTGRHIFETDDIYQTLHNVQQGPIPDPRTFRPELPEALVKINLRALERDLGRRYQSAGQMGYELEYYMYHKGYGPTNVTLGNYMKQYFFSRTPDGRDLERDQTEAVRLAHRADAQYGDLTKPPRPPET